MILLVRSLVLQMGQESVYLLEEMRVSNSVRLLESSTV